MSQFQNLGQQLAQLHFCIEIDLTQRLDHCAKQQKGHPQSRSLLFALGKPLELSDRYQHCCDEVAMHCLYV
jgi:hypothetical protein